MLRLMHRLKPKETIVKMRIFYGSSYKKLIIEISECGFPEIEKEARNLAKKLSNGFENFKHIP